MRLDERKESILDFIVRDYVHTACPVSSFRVSEKKNLDLSPASIRNIMLELDKEGLLHQPHTSAGRAPTKKGYRYFVDNLMGEKSISYGARSDFDKIISSFNGDDLFNELAVCMARNLKLFSGVATRNRIFKRGLSEVLKEPEFLEHDFAVEFAEFADSLEDDIFGFEGVRIDDFGTVSYAAGPEFVIFSVGPKRMDYEKATSFIKYLTKLLWQTKI